MLPEVIRFSRVDRLVEMYKHVTNMLIGYSFYNILNGQFYLKPFVSLILIGWLFFEKCNECADWLFLPFWTYIVDCIVARA